MYSRKAWGGDVDPHILVDFMKDTTEDDSDPIASLVVFEWKDEPLIGIYPTADSEYVCKTSDHLGGEANESVEGIYMRYGNNCKWLLQ